MFLMIFGSILILLVFVIFNDIFRNGSFCNLGDRK